MVILDFSKAFDTVPPPEITSQDGTIWSGRQHKRLAMQLPYKQKDASSQWLCFFGTKRAYAAASPLAYPDHMTGDGK